MNAMRILVIEDDPETGDFLSAALRQTGHDVELITRGREALARINQQTFDLLIVDRMIPEIDGLAVVKSVRAAGVATPVLMLTAMGAIADRVEGLEGGADDYLLKPFSFSELNARVNALARRAVQTGEPTVLTSGDLSLDRLARTVKRRDQVIDLQPREFRLLEELLLNAGRVVTRTMLLERVWDLHFDPGTNIVETHLSRLRSKIDAGGDASLIKTVRGEGYVISS